MYIIAIQAGLLYWSPLILHVVGRNVGQVANLSYLSGYNKCAGRILSEEF